MNPTFPPPSPENLPPPPPEHLPNPHISTHPNTTAALDHKQNAQNLAMDNFRALVLKFAKPLLPAQKSLIEQRLRDFFPNQLHVPDHPTYAAMIQRALVELNEEGGSSEEAISEFIKNEYNDLPWAHATMLEHHLSKLSEIGDIVVTCEGCYLLRSAITKPSPNPNPSPSPSPRHNLTPYCSPCSSSSPYSSSFSSPYSSSSSSRSHSPCPGRRRRPLKRKRKARPVQGRGRGRPRKNIQARARGRPRKKIQGRGQGKPCQKIQGRKLGRPRKKKEIEENFQLKEAQIDVIEVQDGVVEEGNRLEVKGVTEFQNQVMDVEKNKEQNAGQVVLGLLAPNQAQKQHDAIIRPCKNILGRKRGRPPKKIQGRDQGKPRPKIQGRRLGRPRKKKEIEENFQLEEEQIDVIEVEGEVIEEGNQLEEAKQVTEFQNQVMDVEENKEQNAGQKVSAPNPAEQQHDAIIRSDGVVEEWDGCQKQEIGAGEEKNQPQEQQNDGLEERKQPREKEIIDGNQPRKQQDTVIEEQAQHDLNEYIKEQQNVVMIRSDSEDDGPFEESNGQRKQDKGESVEQSLSEKEQNSVIEEQNQPQEQQMERNKEQGHPCSRHRVVWLPARRRKREFEEAEVYHQDEQHKDEVVREEVQLEDVMNEQRDVVMMSSDAEEDAHVQEVNAQQKEEKGGSVEQDQSEEEQSKVYEPKIHQHQLMVGMEDTIHRCQPRQRVSLDQNQSWELEVEVAEKLQNEVIQEKFQLEDGVFEKRNGQQKQVKGASVEPKESEEQQVDVTEVQVQPQEQCMDGTGKKIQLCGEQQRESVEQDQPAKQEVKIADKQHKQEEQQNEVIHKYIELMDEVITEEHRDVVIIQSEAQVKGASVERAESEEQQDDVIGEQVQPQVQCMKGTKDKFLQEVEIPDERYQQEEEQNQVIQKEMGLMDEVTKEQHDIVIIQSEAQVKGASVEHNVSDKREDNVTGQYVEPQEQCMEGTGENFQQRGSMEHDQLEKQEAEICDKRYGHEEQQKELIQKEIELMEEVSEEQPDTVMIQHQAQVKRTRVEQYEQNESEKQQDSGIGEQVQPQAQCMEGTKEKIQLCGQQLRGSVELDQLEKREVEMVDERHQQEEQIEVIQKESELMDEVTKAKHDLVMIQSESQVKKASVERNESEEQQDDVIREQVQPQEQCFQGTKANFQPCGNEQRGRVEKYQLETQEVEIADKLYKREEQQNEVIQKEIELMDDILEEQQDLVMIRNEANEDQSTKEWNGLQKEETKIRVEKHQSEEHENAITEEQNQSQVQCVEGIEKNCQLIMELEYEKIQVKVIAQEQYQQEEQPVEMFEKENQVQEFENVVSSERSQSCDIRGKGSTALPCKSLWPMMEEEKKEVLEKGDQEMKSQCGGEILVAPQPPKLPIPKGPQKVKPMEEQSRPLRKGLRSGNKTLEAAAKTENQHEQIKPFQRILRPRKRNLETDPVTESLVKDLDHSNQRAKGRGCGKPPKRKLESAAADKVSRPRRTKRARS